MKSLTTDAFDRACEFVQRIGRPLEQAQLRYIFGEGTVDEVLTELSKFQNDDGGFGHGMEPDIRMPNSSPLCSSVAFQVLRELEVSDDYEIVRSGISYFANSYQPEIGGWDPTGPDVDEYDRAPWWDYSPIEGRLTPLKVANPGSEICGYLKLFSAGDASNLVVDQVVEDLLNLFFDLPDEIETHALMCFMRMAEMLSDEVTERMLPKLVRASHLAVSENADDWRGYGGRPLWFAPAPSSLLASEFSISVETQLNFEIDSQNADGGWLPVWSYGDRSVALQQATNEWAGWLTLRNLIAFKSWGRI
ncbi:MAG: hypothetical protein HOF01_11280 [Chloroflexi bacterium]|jgi:hypothetical protein|nr:hypothetical protein [Chloroflexota bacterium]